MLDIELSGLALCFAPLAFIIVGFIAAATVGDANARRTYLRRLDLRPEAERIAQPAYEPLTQPVRAATPSGLTLTFTEEAVEEAAKDVVPDDLKRIEGIGPQIELYLKGAGITTFSSLAQKTPAELAQIILDAGGNPNRNNPETWAEQAALAAENRWDDLAALQGELKGGRRI